jgi:hypothetical protein
VNQSGFASITSRLLVRKGLAAPSLLGDEEQLYWESEQKILPGTPQAPRRIELAEVPRKIVLAEVPRQDDETPRVTKISFGGTERRTHPFGRRAANRQ